MASLSQTLRLGDLPPPHRTFQGHATHIIEWSMMLRPNDSWSTCIPQGIATFLHYASRRSAGSRYTARDCRTPETGDDFCVQRKNVFSKATIKTSADPPFYCWL